MHGEHNFLFGLPMMHLVIFSPKCLLFRVFPATTMLSRVSLGEMTGEILIEQGLDLAR